MQVIAIIFSSKFKSIHSKLFSRIIKQVTFTNFLDLFACVCAGMHGSYRPMYIHTQNCVCALWVCPRIPAYVCILECMFAHILLHAHVRAYYMHTHTYKFINTRLRVYIAYMTCKSNSRTHTYTYTCSSVCVWACVLFHNYLHINSPSIS